MNEYLLYYINCVDPFATLADVKEIKEINEWDLLIVFKNGRKTLFDKFTGYYKDIFYDSIHEITEEQEKREFAFRLRSHMARNQITQEDLAEIIDTSQVMISRYVRGETIPSVIVLRKIAKALGCSMDDFFYKEY